MYHLISYDLKTPERNYRALIEAVQQFECVHINGSCWAIRSNLTATQIRNFLAQFIDPSDNLIICDFHNWAGCHLASNIANWMTR